MDFKLTQLVTGFFLLLLLLCSCKSIERVQSGQNCHIECPPFEIIGNDIIIENDLVRGGVTVEAYFTEDAIVADFKIISMGIRDRNGKQYWYSKKSTKDKVYPYWMNEYVALVDKKLKSMLFQRTNCEIEEKDKNRMMFHLFFRYFKNNVSYQ